jgi:ABC-type dipeptide/oligopeptide/nickel transport system permease component
MGRFFVRRLISIIPLLFIVLLIIFSLTHLIPGDPATVLLGPGATESQINALRDQLHLDKPLVEQFFLYVKGLLMGDMGNSLKTGQPVLDELKLRLPATIELSVFALVIAVLIGVPLGVTNAIWKNSPIDHFGRITSLIGVSAPAFWLALLLQLLFANVLHLLPVAGRIDPYVRYEPASGFLLIDSIITGNWVMLGDTILHLILPSLVLAAFLGATIARFIRTSMLEVMGEDYTRTAYAKGLSKVGVITKHVLRNSLLPAVTITGLKFAEMLGGAILTETVFSWPGMGRFMFEAIKNRDYPVIQGTTMVFALIYIFTSLVIDVIYSLLDPQIRVS